MIAFTLTTLFAVVTIATALALADFWLRARSAHASLKRQAALAAAGFVPQVDAEFVRLRPSAERRQPSAARPYATRLPRRMGSSAHALGAA
ncbi:hypothetical protein [Erythrobacter sp. THAF29]|uniref:hypothetical protein n=1 Tax=Erythrobacter sp. THAF29 TaxID=2587851 RepID=UPI0012692C1A|nr:hypothetical protein [Erythrobacter sp. THAF29]QFT77438.1 hypothetical protein FIU90_07800 [Erythrobacter sp. THAF29]